MIKGYDLSIVIPTFNEAENIVALINYLQENINGVSIEIIIADGKSTDSTVIDATGAGATVVISAIKSRSAQMNYGAAAAKAPVLYFLHADSFPPVSYTSKIIEQISKGYSIGCFRLQFDKPHWFLKANAWFTKFNYNAFRFGDQSLFVLKEVFIKAGGFNEKLIVMEDQEIIHRLRKYGTFKVLPQYITTSARKYTVNGIYKMQLIFFLIYFLYKTGLSQKRLAEFYYRLIKQDNA